VELFQQPWDGTEWVPGDYVGYSITDPPAHTDEWPGAALQIILMALAIALGMRLKELRTK
jgi:hypothetical protein